MVCGVYVERKQRKFGGGVDWTGLDWMTAGREHGVTVTTRQVLSKLTHMGGTLTGVSSRVALAGRAQSRPVRTYVP